MTFRLRFDMTSGYLDPGTFHGDVTPMHSAERVTISESVHRRDECLPSHAHRRPYLSFVLRGAYLEAVGRRRLTCETLALRFHPAGEEHANTFGPTGAVCLNIELTGDWADPLDQLDVRSGSILTEAGAASVLRLYREGHDLTHVSGLLVEEVTLDLLVLCARRQHDTRVAANSAAIRCAIDYLEANLMAAMTLQAVAAAAGVHVTHLARLFRAKLGCTVTDYVRTRRLELAQRVLILRPDWHLSRVAVEHGFADHAHFTRTFRRKFDVTPSAFRTLACRIASRQRLPAT
ncbi:MAG: helix-turn-helix transcriptional regulator [Gemmatimonadaceae bacterium]